jgi:hypothetical protein
MQYDYRNDDQMSSNADASINAWVKTWFIAKPMISGLIVIVLWCAHSLYANGWLNVPVKSTELVSVTNDQKITNIELKNSIDSLSHKSDEHARVIERLVLVSEDMRTDLAAIKGSMATSQRDHRQSLPTTSPVSSRSR